MNRSFARAARWLGAVVLILPSAFAMHLHLVKSTPKEGEVVTIVPTQVRLWFSQKPEAALTSIRLLREDSSAINLGKVARTDDSLSVAAPSRLVFSPVSTSSRGGHCPRMGMRSGATTSSPSLQERQPGNRPAGISVRHETGHGGLRPVD